MGRNFGTGNPLYWLSLVHNRFLACVIGLLLERGRYGLGKMSGLFGLGACPRGVHSRFMFVSGYLAYGYILSRSRLGAYPLRHWSPRPAPL
jgi:hypothetical protein